MIAVIDYLPCSDVLDLLNKAKLSIDGLFGHIEFDNRKTVRVADFYQRKDGRCVISVGRRELIENFDKVLPVGEALVPVVNLFHEVCGHGAQFDLEFQKHNALSTVLASSYYGCCSSNRYYGMPDDNIPQPVYFNHPHEIAAQYMGLVTAHEFLSHVYDSAEADSMLMKYEQYRIDCKSEFIDSIDGCKSFKDVLDKFKSRFKDAVFEHHDYECHLEDNDCLGVIMTNVPGLGDLAERVEKCKWGFQQDAMMTATLLACDKDTKVRCSSLPAFKNVDLSVQNMFGLRGKACMPKPRRWQMNLDKLDRPELGDWTASNDASSSGDDFEP